MIVGVVLAAGSATRFGRPKVLAKLHDIELVRHVVDRLEASGLQQIVVATAPGSLEGIRDALVGTRAAVVSVPRASDGLSESLKAALVELPPECTGFLVALGDQPLIDPTVVRRLRETWESSNAAAVVPVYRGTGRGNPVFFDATMHRRLRELSGDQGARALLEAMGDRVVEVPIDARAPADVDTPDDLARLQNRA